MRKLIFILLCGIMFSCSDEALMDQRENFDNNSWGYQQKVSFDYEAKDSTDLVDILILFRTTIDYAYSNMFVIMETSMPNETTDTDTLQFILAEPSGKWIGNRVGNIVEFEIKVSKSVKFPEKGVYYFSFQHGMQDEVLNEVLDFGMRIIPSEK